MARNISDAVRELCLSFPESEEQQSHGMANFRVRGKASATYAINHHGDGRVVLWLQVQTGAQALYPEMEPESYFVPPYVGPRGWLGVKLNTGLGWDSIALRVGEAYEKVAPSELTRAIAGTITIPTEMADLSAEEIDPLMQPRAQKVLKQLAEICAELPETSVARQFGNPVFKAGKKSFVCIHRYDQRLCLQVWVGIDQQGFLTMGDRYTIPPYVGHNGWIDLDIEEEINWQEVRELVLNSYRHFALKRMLKQLA